MNSEAMMVTFLMILVTAVVLLLVILLHGNRGTGGSPVNLSAKRPVRQKVEHSPDRGRQPSGGAPEGALEDAATAPAGYPPEGSGTSPDCLTDGMARLFTGEVPSPVKAAPLGIDAVPDEVREQILSRIASLKNFDTLQHLQRMMGDPRSTMTELSHIITSNPLLSARILQVANSPYYGMQQKLNSISHAIMIIGMNNLKAIVYHEGVMRVLKEKSFRDDPAMQTLWQHMNYTSICASYIQYLFGGLNMGTLFTLGLLHDIGKFILMREVPLGHIGVEAAGHYSPEWTTAEEEEHCGINHALVGRLALQHWGLSPLMVEAVALHHAPADLPPEALGLDQETLSYLVILFLADQAAKLFAGAGKDDVRTDRLHPAYHGLIDQNKLFRLIADKSLLAQLREAEAITGVYA